MSETLPKPDWIAVDWGTSNLRVWAMRASGKVLQHVRSDRGMSGLRPEDFEPHLVSLIEPWLSKQATPVIACGMVGARRAWSEAPYRVVPTTPIGDLHRLPGKDLRLAVHVVPGLKQARPPDVMRGEETQIAGFLGENPSFDGVLCMPGTHTKWVHISAGEIVSFQTFMTGELFDLLSHQSVLRHSTGPGTDWDSSQFDDAVSDTLSNPAMLGARLFQLRAADLLEDTPAATTRARMSGLLIGAELAAAKPYWLGQNLALVGPPPLGALYAAALLSQGVIAAQQPSDDMVVKGLTAAYQESLT